MDATTEEGGEVHCLRGRPKKPASLHLVDGFPLNDGFNFLPNTPDPTHNPWSYGKTITIDVWYDSYWQNLKAGIYRRSVTWKGKTVVVEDYEWFQMLIRQWMKSTWYPKTKEQALDLFFEME